MILITVIWIWIFVLLVSIGRFLFDYIIFSKSHSTFLAFVTGLILYSTIISFWNVFFPANEIFPLIISLVLIKPIIREFNRIKGYFFEINFITRFTLLISLLFALYFSVLRSTVFDTYLYHNSIITFFNKYNLIPGLSHLHDRFGFNNLTYCLCSSFLFENSVPYYHFHGLLLFVIIYYLMIGVLKNKNITFRFLNFFLTIWIFRLSEEMLSSPDTVINLLIIFFVVHKLRNGFVFNKEDLIFLVFIPTIKFSAVIFSVLFFIIGFLQLRKLRELDGRILVICSLIVLTFVGRNVLLTGQLVYPLKTPYLDIFDFRLSKQTIENEIVGIDGWARFPGHDYAENYYKYKNLSDWFPVVIKNNFNDKYTRLPLFGEISNKVVYAFYVFGFILMLFQLFIENRSNKNLLIPVFLFISFLFILIKAPNARWFELYLYLAFLIVIYLSKSQLRYLFVLITFILAIPYQTKRLVENTLIHSKLWAKPSLIIMPENIEFDFERKPIRSVLIPSEGINDYNTIFTKLDTIEGLNSKDRFIYRYSYQSNGLSPMTDEVSVPYKVNESIKFTGRSFVNKDLISDK